MSIMQSQVERYAIYRGHGDVDGVDAEPLGDWMTREAIPERASICAIMSRDLICARPDLQIASIVSLIIEHRIGCIPVVDGRRRPLGVITKFDLVEELDAAMQCSFRGYPLAAELATKTANDVMMPLALTLDIHATVTHAAAMMMSEEMHHVLVVKDDGALVGVVSAKDIVGWVMNNHAPRIRCPRGSGAPPVWPPLEE